MVAFHHIDLLARFDRERIPERVVHAKGAGAHGYYEVTHDISDICSSNFLSSVGTKARTTIRFSTGSGEAGSADTARAPHGFAIKIRTNEGNMDWVFNSTPVFFIRDPVKFPVLSHIQKRHPQSHLRNADIFWDFMSQSPKSIHQLMILYSDRGTPDGYAPSNGYSGHTFKLVKEDSSFVYAQIHVRADGGVKTLSSAEASRLSAENPDYDLFEAIETGQPLSWTVYIQTMTPTQAEAFRYNVLNITKVWPHAEFPLRQIGKIVLNENPQNYFAEIEQVAFSPSHLIPYVEYSADPMLQSRLFSYPDSQRYRLGANYQQLPVNAPLSPVANFQRDGKGTFISQGPRPDYQSKFAPLLYEGRKGAIEGSANDAAREQAHEKFIGGAYRQLSEITALDFEQPRALWSVVWDDSARATFVQNVAGHISRVKSAEIKARQLSVFAVVDQDLSDRIAKAISAPAVTPLQVKPASTAIRFRANIALKVPQ